MLDTVLKVIQLPPLQKTRNVPYRTVTTFQKTYQQKWSHYVALLVRYDENCIWFTSASSQAFKLMQHALPHGLHQSNHCYAKTYAV